MRVVDTHLHLWDLESGGYPWISEALGPLHRSFGWQEAELELAAADVDAVVLVQADDTEADTRAMLGVAEVWSRVVGVVGWLPLDQPDRCAALLTEWQEIGPLVGVRHALLNDWCDGSLEDGRFDDGLALIARHGLALDVTTPDAVALRGVSTLAGRHPDLRIVVDHLGSPSIASGDWEPWATLLRDAAAHPKVHAKVSGLLTLATPTASRFEDIGRYVAHAIEVFGPHRLMMGSDWPVVTQSGSYADAQQMCGSMLDSIAESERSALQWRTACNCYGLRLEGVEAGDP